ncbi:MAG TPA: response regulator transcription factor [archaeon]|nr:response regulator transcription factor [archaeon]
MIRVLVASASAVGRPGLETLIATDRSLEVVGRSATLTTLAREIEDVQPDVIVVQLDTRTHGGLGEFPAIFRVRDELDPPAVVVLADPQQSAGLAKAIQSGITALLPLDATLTEMKGAIEAAVAGLIVVHPAFLDVLPEIQPASRQPAEIPKSPLTAREVEVLNLVAQGLGNKEIASRLGISEHTVKFHIGSIFNKLDASSRTEAVTLGIRAGSIML